MRKLYADIVTVLMIMLIVISGVMILRRKPKMAVEFSGIQEQGFGWGDVSSLDHFDGDWSQKTIVVWLEQDTYQTNTVLVKCEGSGSVINWALWLNAGANDGYVYYRQSFSGDDGEWYALTGTVSTSAKHMVGLVYDKTSNANAPQFYISGTLWSDYEITAPTGSVDTGTPSYFNIGQGVGSSFYSIDGTIYLVAIYDRLLSESELDDLHNSRSVKQFYAHEGLVFLTAMDGSPGVQNYDGHTFTGSEGVIDDVNGYLGTQDNSPVAVADDYLHR